MTQCLREAVALAEDLGSYDDSQLSTTPVSVDLKPSFGSKGNHMVQYIHEGKTFIHIK